MINMRKSEMKGTCQACFLVQKLPNGKISLHGYERPGDGYIMGDCEGSYHLPYEQSCETTKTVLGFKLRAKKVLEETLTSLRSFPDTVVIDIYTYHSNGVREYEEVEVGKEHKKSFHFKDNNGKIRIIPSYDDVLKQRIHETEMELRHREERISFLQGKIDQWKPTDLLPLEEEKPKFLIQFRFTGSTYVDYYKSTETIRKPVNVWFDKKITTEDNVQHSIDILYKEYKYENLAGIFEARSVRLPDKHILKKYRESDYQAP